MSWISKSLIVVLLFAPARVAAQEGPTDRGSVVLGGSISWSSLGGELYEDSDEERYTSILLNPVALFFVAPGLAVGGDLYVENESQGNADATTIVVGPAVAYFFG